METLNFPDYNFQTLQTTVIAGVIGLVITITAIYRWKIRFTQWKNRTSDHEIGQPSGRLIIMTLLGPIFVFIGTFVSVANIYEIREYRSIQLDKVIALKLYRIDERGRTLFINPRLISDNLTAKSGLSRVDDCSIIEPEKGYTLSDGYLIEMFSEDEKFIGQFNVYKHMFRIEDGSILRISDSLLTLKGNSLYDVYRCPALHEWVNEQIDPLFAN